MDIKKCIPTNFDDPLTLFLDSTFIIKKFAPAPSFSKLCYIGDPSFISTVILRAMLQYEQSSISKQFVLPSHSCGLIS